MKSICEFCGREFETKNACNSHRGKCKKNPNSKGVSEKWLKAMKDLNHSEHQLETKKIYVCEFCNKTWETTKGGFSLHKRLCEKNPNKKEHNWCGKKHSNETKERMSETAKKIYFEVDGRTHFTESGILHDKERTEFLLNEGWTCIGRCNWSQYQKLSREDKEKYVQEIEKKIIEWVNV